jgi:hypothetical protein
MKKSFRFSLREKIRMRGILKKIFKSKIALAPTLSRWEREFFAAA